MRLLHTSRRAWAPKDSIGACGVLILRLNTGLIGESVDIGDD